MSPSDRIKQLGYQYRTVRVEHLQELKAQREQLEREGRLSTQPTFRGYIDGHKFSAPDSFPDAKYVVILAIFMPLLQVDFHWNGKVYPVWLPPAYYDSGFTEADRQALVAEEILPKQGFKAERTRQIPLKPLVVRSGLGRYGRNNICYIGEMGTFATLAAYFTDFEFPQDDWGEMKMLDLCEKCRVCLKECPTQAIREEDFVISTARCLPLYNEVEGTFPDWIEPSAHNALMGCLRCQVKCPANRTGLQRAEKLEDITEEETAQILSGHPDETVRETVYRKLRGFEAASSQEYIPIFVRNLKALLN